MMMENNRILSGIEDYHNYGVADYPNLREAGEFTAVLRLRIWGKKKNHGNNLRCCFECLDVGHEREQFSVYAWSNDRAIYTAKSKECNVDMREVLNGTTMKIRMRQTRAGNFSFDFVEILEEPEE